MRLVLSLVSLIASGAVWAGCRSDVPAAPPPAAEAGDGARQAEAPDGGPFLLTEEKLEGFVRYRRHLAEQRAAPAAPEASSSSRSGVEARVLWRARAEEAARGIGGLTEREVELIEPLVMDVLIRRAYAQGPALAEQVAQLESLVAKLSGSQRAEVGGMLEETRLALAEDAALGEERARHGDANVDAVLARYDALWELHRAWLDELEGAPP